MPIRVACPCGKVFKARDEAAGTRMRCQVCGAELAVPSAAAASAGETRSCPFCAEGIAADKCRDRWYLAEGEFQGPLDRLRLDRT